MTELDLDPKEVTPGSRPRPLITGRVALVAGMVLGISSLAFFRIPLLPVIGEDLTLTAVEIGTITVCFALGRLCTDLPAGRLADRVPPATSYMYAGLAMAAGSGLLALASSNAIAWAAAFVIGVGSSIGNTTGMSYFSRIGDRSNRGRYMALFSTALLGGQALGPTLGGVVAEFGSWRTAEAVAAVLATLIAIACLWLNRSSADGPNGSILALDEPADVPAEAGGETPAIPRIELAILFSIAFSVFFTTGGMTQTLIPLIGDEKMALSTALIGFALGLGGLFRLAGGLIGGFVSDRFSRKSALVPGLLIPAAGVLLVAVWAQPAGWMTSIALISIGSIGIASAGTMLGDRTGKGRSGSVFGQFRFVGDLGLLAGPLVSTLLYSQVGYQAPLIFTAALLTACAVVSALFLPEHQASESTEPGQV